MDERVKCLYDRAPIWSQDIAVSLKGLQLQRQRYGNDFEEIMSTVKRRDQLSRAELKEIQKTRLSEFLSIAATAPFWKQRFDEYNIKTDGGDPFEELSKLPVLTKREVKGATRSFIPEGFENKTLYDCHTSGTTGSGLQFVQTRRALQEQWAVWWRYRHRFGLDRDTWCGYFGGRPVVPAEQDKPPYWRINHPAKQVLFSTFHIGTETATAYFDEIRDREFTWLHGYPSALALLANLALDKGLQPPKSVETVTTGAETLFEHQRVSISDAFDADVFQHYGLAESVANISECPAGTLHVDEDFAYVELLEGENGRNIVGTNWSNPAFPLLRYDTGDLATVSETACDCNYHGRIVESLDGRSEDYVVLPNGTKVGRLDHIFKDAEAVTEAQLYQPSVERLVFRIVPSSEFSETQEVEVRSKARERLGENIVFEFEYLDQVPRTDSGKIKFVVSEVTDASISEPAW
jgi:phenylacetate-CoA ligase